MVKENLCIIPAKGNSERLPGKNIRLVRGLPMVAYTIKAAVSSGIFDCIAVSTNDRNTADISVRYGAEIPYLRPEELTRDEAKVPDVCLHLIEFLESQGRKFKTLFILLATSPLRTAQDITESYEAYKKSGCKFLMSVSEFSHTPFWTLGLNEKGELYPFFPEMMTRTRQELPKAYKSNGAITIVDIEEFKKTRDYYSYPLASYIMPLSRSVDVDTELDLKLLETILAGQGGVDSV